MQILQGCPGVKSSEIVIDFIHTSHQYFIGGVFWINCRSREFVSASIHNIEKVSATMGGYSIVVLLLTDSL